MTQLVPFVIFGVGLDDTFIIVGSFARTDPNKSIEERISATMQDIGLSISVTTLTTSFAFGLGSLSNIPAVRWVCFYSLTAIAVDFIYQITLFVAFLVLDERRVQANRGDLCCCCELEDEGEDEAREPNKIAAPPQENFIDHFMVWYAEQLLRPCVKVLVLLAFAALTGGCIYSTTKFRQEFRVTELLPDGSYVTSFFNVFQEYYSRSLPLFVYFRDVDQSDPEIQRQMVNYVDELAELDNFDDDVPFCWVKDLPQVRTTKLLLSHVASVQPSAARTALLLLSFQLIVAPNSLVSLSYHCWIGSCQRAVCISTKLYLQRPNRYSARVQGSTRNLRAKYHSQWRW